MFDENSKESKPAFIIKVVTDQGTGGAYCSNCYEDLDYLCEKHSLLIRKLLDLRFSQHSLPAEQKKIQTTHLKEELSSLYVCPSCHYSLEEGGTYIQAGGSDF